MAVLRQKVRSAVQRIPFGQILKIICLVLSGTGCVLKYISPFGIACAAAMYTVSYGNAAVLLIVPGIFLGGFGTVTFKYLIALLLLTIASARSSLFSTNIRSGCMCAISLFLADLIYCGFAGSDMFFWLTASAEIVAGFFSVHIYAVMLRCFSNQRVRKTVTKEEFICVAAVICICMSGASRFSLPGGVQIVSVTAILVLFFCAYSFPAGVCGVAGTILGFLASLANPEMLYSVGTYSMASIICSLCKKTGKIGIVTGFVLTNALFTFYVNGSQNVLINVTEICIAGGIFVLLPGRQMMRIKQRILLWLQRPELYKKTEREALEKMAVKRLNRIADAFSVMSASMKKGATEQKGEQKEIAGALAEDVYARVCGTCAKKEVCPICYKSAKDEIRAVLQKTIHRGWAELYDATGSLKAYCVYNEKVISECNKVYELFRVNRVWENRILENRELVSDQLKEVSGVVRHLADEITETVVLEEKSEKSIFLLLDGMGISVENVIVTKGIHNRLEAEIFLTECRRKNMCERDVQAVLKKVTGKSFSVKKEKCSHEKYVLKCREKEKFEAQIGIARRRPVEEKACGDSYAILRPEDGKLVVALSDGMGRGSRAARESKEAVDLLEHLLMAGIARDSAVRLINSVLVLKSYDENFATLDLLVLDLFTGEGELIKNASACSYICRGNQVGVLAAQALPAGILGEMETANRKLVFREGDLILIVSDGVTDVCVDDKWIKDFMLELKNSTAQQGADMLMEEAVRRVLICRDDMTVILVKISEK